jgi:Fic family protein
VHSVLKAAMLHFWLAYLHPFCDGNGRTARALFYHRQRALLSRARKDSEAVFTIGSHRSSHNVAYATARSDLLALAERGYLVQVRRGRSFEFLPAPGIRERLESRTE